MAFTKTGHELTKEAGPISNWIARKSWNGAKRTGRVAKGGAKLLGRAADKMER